MQEPEIARPPKAFRQHMLKHQPEEVCAGHRALLHAPGFGVAIAEGHLAVAAGDDVLFADDAAVEIAAEVDECRSAAADFWPYRPLDISFAAL